MLTDYETIRRLRMIRYSPAVRFRIRIWRKSLCGKRPRLFLWVLCPDAKPGAKIPLSSNGLAVAVHESRSDPQPGSGIGPIGDGVRPDGEPAMANSGGERAWDQGERTCQSASRTDVL